MTLITLYIGIWVDTQVFKIKLVANYGAYVSIFVIKHVTKFYSFSVKSSLIDNYYTHVNGHIVVKEIKIKIF